MKEISREEVCQAVTQAVMLCLDYIEQQSRIRDAPSPAERLYTYDDLAEMLGKSKSTIRQWVRAGEFGKPIKVGSSTRVTQAGVDKYIFDHSGTAKKKAAHVRAQTARTTAGQQDLTAMRI